jgi:hypothetical protein
MTTLVLCSDKNIEHQFNQKFNNYIFGDKSMINNYDNILIIGDYIHISNTSVKVSWLVTESVCNISLQNGMYDRVDYFFGMYTENLKNRYGDKYVKLGDNI